jgi:hypothetical protein
VWVATGFIVHFLQAGAGSNETGREGLEATLHSATAGREDGQPCRRNKQSHETREASKRGGLQVQRGQAVERPAELWEGANINSMEQTLMLRCSRPRTGWM